MDLAANNGPRAAAIVWVLLVLSGSFLGLRMYCKITRHRGLWWDDHALIASWTALLVDISLVTWLITLGYGKHTQVLPLDSYGPVLMVGNVSGVFAICALAWSKTSFAITLLRISDGWIKKAVWVIILTTNVALGMTTLLHWIQCRPVEKTWKFWIPGTCWDFRVIISYDIFSGAYSATMDFVLAFLPWCLIKDLQMKKRERIGVAIAMGMGVFAGATAIVKCAHITTLLDVEDFSFTGVELFIWGTAEIAMTIIAASIPVLRVLIREAKTSRNQYQHNTNTNGDPTRRSRGTHNTIISGGYDVERGSFNGNRRGDGDSEKSILAPGKIVKTNEFAIEYHDRSDVDGESYEMGRVKDFTP